MTLDTAVLRAATEPLVSQGWRGDPAFPGVHADGTPLPLWCLKKGVAGDVLPTLPPMPLLVNQKQGVLNAWTWAVQWGMPHLPELIRLGADVDQLNEHGETALMVACNHNGGRAAVVALLAAGADPDRAIGGFPSRQHNLACAVVYAARVDPQCLALLLEAGADASPVAAMMQAASDTFPPDSLALVEAWRGQRHLSKRLPCPTGHGADRPRL